MSSILGSAFVDGVLRGGIPLGLALNRDAREEQEQEQLIKLRDAQEKRASEAHELTMSTNQEAFNDSQAKRQLGMLRGLYDAHNGDMTSMVRSPQGGVLLAQMLQNQPEYAERIGSNPGYKAASFVPTADGKEFMLMLQGPNGEHAPLTVDRAPGSAAVKFSEQQLSGIMAMTAGRIGEVDPESANKIMDELGVQDKGQFMADLNVTSQSAAAPDAIPMKPNLGAVAREISAQRTDSFSTNAASAKTVVQSPLSPDGRKAATAAPEAPSKSQSTPLKRSTITEGPYKGQVFGKDEERSLRILMAENGTDIDGAPLTPAQQAATLEALKNGQVPEAKDTPSSAALARGAQQVLGRGNGADLEAKPELYTRTPLRTPEQKKAREAALEAQYVAANKKAQAERAPFLNTATQVLDAVVNPINTTVRPMVEKAASYISEKAQAHGEKVRRGIENRKRAEAGLPPLTAEVSHKENRKAGIVSDGAYSDEDLAAEGVADNRNGYKVNATVAPQNKAEKSAMTGAVPAKAVATPESHAQVAAATETQIRSESLPQRVYNDGVALRTMQGAVGGRITARQRYAAMRAHQTGLISDSMYANYLQSGRFSFDDVHAAVAVQNLRLSAMRIAQDAAQSERNYLLEKEKLGIMRKVKAAEAQGDAQRQTIELNKALREEYKYNVGQVDNMIKTRAGVAYSSLTNAQGAPRYFGAVDSDGNVDTKLAENVTQSMMSVVLQDPVSRSLVTGTNKRYDQLTANDVDRTTELFHAFINDPKNLQRYEDNDSILSWSDSQPGSINASAGSFVQWLSTNPRILRKQNRARTMEYTEQGEEE